MRQLVISMVNYINSSPFGYGLQMIDSDRFQTMLDSPAACVRKLLAGEAQLGLVPVVAAPELTPTMRLPDWGIACDGAVGSVCVFSQLPIEQLEHIYLDYQSRTSNQLLNILMQEYFDTGAILIDSKPGYEDSIAGYTGGLLIGDRALRSKSKFAYCYDLGAAWKTLTGLPFVFAQWVSTVKLGHTHVEHLNRAFEAGVKAIDQIISREQARFPNIDLHDYLSNKIQHRIDERHHQGLQLFMDKLSVENV